MIEAFYHLGNTFVKHNGDWMLIGGILHRRLREIEQENHKRFIVNPTIQIPKKIIGNDQGYFDFLGLSFLADNGEMVIGWIIFPGGELPPDDLLVRYI